MNDDAIDIVMPWVDGNDPVHLNKRQEFLVEPPTEGPEYVLQEYNAPQRWVQADEVRYALRSIGRFAPWVRKIWIVTDGQIPNMDGFEQDLLDKIEIVDHKVIFRGFEKVLPTFNSATIESALWLIPGLAEKFILFNDDIFFTQPIQPTDFFRNGKLVLRGRLQSRKLITVAPMWDMHQKNGAELAGFDKESYFKLTHVCQPLFKSKLEQFFEKNPEAFAKNITHRIRHNDQFNIASVSSHLAIIGGYAETISGDDKDQRDWRVIGAAPIAEKSGPSLWVRLQKIRRKRTKIVCINDFATLQRKVPTTRKILEKILSRRA